jgi:hypothetical protein
MLPCYRLFCVINLLVPAETGAAVAHAAAAAAAFPSFGVFLSYFVLLTDLYRARVVKLKVPIVSDYNKK